MERERLRHRHTDTTRTLLQALAPVASSNRTAHAASSKVPYQHPSKQSTIVTKHNSNVRSQYLVDQRGQVPGFRTALARYEPFWAVLLQMLECGAALRRNRDPLDDGHHTKRYRSRLLIRTDPDRFQMFETTRRALCIPSVLATRKTNVMATSPGASSWFCLQCCTTLSAPGSNNVMPPDIKLEPSTNVVYTSAHFLIKYSRHPGPSAYIGNNSGL